MFLLKKILQPFFGLRQLGFEGLHATPQPFCRLAGGLFARFQGALNEPVPQGMDNLAGELGIVRVEADIHQLRFGSGRDGESIDKVVDQPFPIDASASRFFSLRCQRQQPTKPPLPKRVPFLGVLELGIFREFQLVDHLLRQVPGFKDFKLGFEVFAFGGVRFIDFFNRQHLGRLRLDH